MKTAGLSGPVVCGDPGLGKKTDPVWTKWVSGTLPHWRPFALHRSLTRSFWHLTLRLILLMETSHWPSSQKSQPLCIPWGERELQRLNEAAFVCYLRSLFNAALFREGCSGPGPDALTTCTGTRRCCCATIRSKRPSVCMKTPAVMKTATRTKRR